MKLRINDQEFKYFNKVDVSLNYDAIASAFSFEVLFDPNNPTHREIFRPDMYYDAKVVDDNNRLLIEGNLLSSTFNSSSIKNTTKVNGYTYTGILEDCQIPSNLYPLQVKGMSLYDICKKICIPLGVEVVIDMDVWDRISKPFDTALAKDTMDIKQFLCELASHRQILITHTEDGHLFLTEAKTDTEPVFFFEKGMPGIEFELGFNGQAMHSNIEVQRQQSKKNKAKATANIENPYCKTRFRPTVKRQSSGDNVEDVNTTARNALSEELKALELNIKIHDWYVGDNILIRPNKLISIVNPELFIYQPTTFFIENVKFSGDSKEKTTTLTCYLPEVYNNKPVTKNIFD